jgi:hypothetical protein
MIDFTRDNNDLIFYASQIAVRYLKARHIETRKNACPRLIFCFKERGVSNGFQTVEVEVTERQRMGNSKVGMQVSRMCRSFSARRLTPPLVCTLRPVPQNLSEHKNERSKAVERPADKRLIGLTRNSAGLDSLIQMPRRIILAKHVVLDDTIARAVSEQAVRKPSEWVKGETSYQTED